MVHLQCLEEHPTHSISLTTAVYHQDDEEERGEDKAALSGVDVTLSGDRADLQLFILLVNPCFYAQNSSSALGIT